MMYTPAFSRIQKPVRTTVGSQLLGILVEIDVGRMTGKIERADF